jgi:predicted enzyme related to lactoylglutathione lyase
VIAVSFLMHISFAQEKKEGVRGDAEAIVEAEAMVETMGGMEIWAHLKSVHFVHEWRPYYKVDSYIENEILDLTGPRSWVEMKSEIYHRLRAYSPEYKYWNIINGKFSYAEEKAFANAMERAPFSIYRIARAVAIGDPYYEIRFGKGDIPGSRRLEFSGPDGIMGGWIILNARKEPIVWATTQYRYTFGPMKRFGNLRVPNWAVYENGTIMYEMISLKGSNQPPDLALFQPPLEHRKENPKSYSRKEKKINMKKTTMKIKMTSIYVHSPSDAIEFYTEVLGFTKKMFVPEANLAIVASPEDPDGTQLLLEPNDNPIAKSYQGDIYKTGLPVIVFGVDDIQKEYKRLKNAGVVFKQEPTTTEWGMVAIFDDTCGNYIQLIQTEE